MFRLVRIFGTATVVLFAVIFCAHIPSAVATSDPDYASTECFIDTALGGGPLNASVSSGNLYNTSSTQSLTMYCPVPNDPPFAQMYDIEDIYLYVHDGSSTTYVLATLGFGSYSNSTSWTSCGNRTSADGDSSLTWTGLSSAGACFASPLDSHPINIYVILPAKDGSNVSKLMGYTVFDND
jgi:hypothetical protein